MTKFSTCTACKLQQRSIKTRETIAHTCAKSDPKYKEPDTQVFTRGEGVSFLPNGTYYKIGIHKLIFATSKATKYSVRRGQFLNGYKVPPGNESWFDNNLHFMDTNLPLQPCIWVHEKFYNQLAFV